MSVRRAESFTITIAAVDVEKRPARKAGIIFAPGDARISTDGGAFAPAVNVPAEIGSSGRYALTLTAPEMDGAWVHVYVEKDGIDPIDVFLGTAGNPSGAVVADGGNSTAAFKTNRGEATADHWKDCLVLFTSGALAGQVKKASGYNGVTSVLTVSSAYTGIPAPGDRFVLINL